MNANPGQVTITLHAVGPEGHVQFHQPGRLHPTPRTPGETITIPAADLVHDGGNLAYGKLIVDAVSSEWQGGATLHTITDHVRVYLRITGVASDILSVAVGESDWETSVTLTGVSEETPSTA